MNFASGLMAILVTIIILILLGAFWRQIVAGSLLLIALGVIGIFVIACLAWWSAPHYGFDYEWGGMWQKTEGSRPVGQGGPSFRF